MRTQADRSLPFCQQPNCNAEQRTLGDTRFVKRASASGPELRMLDDDRQWFAANPERIFRCRRAMIGDASAFGDYMQPGNHVVVRKVVGMMRLRVPCDVRPGDDTETEDGCRELWRRATAGDARFSESNMGTLRLSVAIAIAAHEAAHAADGGQKQ